MLGRTAISVLAAMLLLITAAHAEDVRERKSAFWPGQQWSIKSPSPTTTKVVIGRIEPWHGKVAVHVSVMDIPRTPGAPGEGKTTSVAHLPFEESALAASVDRLLARGVSPHPRFEAGYKQWRSAEKAGIFSISVTETIEAVFDAFSQNKR